jgi:dGTPase
VDLIEKRYAHPGLNLTDPVREGIYKSEAVARHPGADPSGLREGLPPLFEAQAVHLADRIASVVQELDDALQSGAVDLPEVERLAAVERLRGKLGQSYPARGARFMRINAIHRGLTHMLITDAVLSSARALERWAEKHGVQSPAAFRAVRDEQVGGHEIGLSGPGRKALDEIDDRLERRVRRVHTADRVSSRGRHVLLGLFGACWADPLLLEDHVLLRFKERVRVKFLRDLPRETVAAEVARRYRTSPDFVRLLADHLASMTDSYALAEHRRLMEMGAVPIPGAERLRGERNGSAEASPD